MNNKVQSALGAYRYHSVNVIMLTNAQIALCTRKQLILSAVAIIQIISQGPIVQLTKYWILKDQMEASNWISLKIG